jgi:hypothetical protein
VSPWISIPTYRRWALTGDTANVDATTLPIPTASAGLQQATPLGKATLYVVGKVLPPSLDTPSVPLGLRRYTVVGAEAAAVVRGGGPEPAGGAVHCPCPAGDGGCNHVACGSATTMIPNPCPAT